MTPSIWTGCYDLRWNGEITDESFQHPAKYSRGLIERIITHGLARGYWQRGDLIGDCFGGIGSGGVVAAYYGLRWRGVELESKFVKLGNDNFALHEYRWKALGAPQPEIQQGDSRRFDEYMAAAAVVTSPPYADSIHDGNGIGVSKLTGNRPVDAAICSPPFTTDQPCASQSKAKKDYHAFTRGNGTKREQDMDTEGNIQTLKGGSIDSVITSPPFRDARSDTTKAGMTKGGGPCADRLHTVQAGTVYGETDGQVDNLKTGVVDSVITSPPWEDNAQGHVGAKKWGDPEKAAAHMAAHCAGNGTTAEARKRQFERDSQKEYGATEGNIGNTSKQTYWEAVRDVYAAVLRSLKPGGYFVLVTKDYVRDKQRVPLSDDTMRLLEHVGFEPVERIHAMLVSEQRHAGLFGPDVVESKSRKSFFRRLAEKNGSPRIDHEDVLVVRKGA